MASNNQEPNKLKQNEPSPSNSDPGSFRVKRPNAKVKINSNETKFHPNSRINNGRKSFQNKSNVERNVKGHRGTEDHTDSCNSTQKSVLSPEEKKIKDADPTNKGKNGSHRKEQNFGNKVHQYSKTNQGNKPNLQPRHYSAKKRNPESSNGKLLSPEHQLQNSNCNNSHPNQDGKTSPLRKDAVSKKVKFVTNKANTVSIIRELKKASFGENKCNLEKITEMLTKSDISVEYEVLLDFIDLVSKISQQKSTKKLEILQLVFQKKLLDAVLTFMQQKTKELTKTDEGKEKCNRFFEKFLRLSALAIQLLPSSSLVYLKHTLVFTKTILCRLEGRLQITHQHFDFQKMANQIEKKAKIEEEAKEEVFLIDVEKMKNMSILPTVDDLFGKPPELKKNVVEGSYKNTDHYLTVQFTLLHEDFIAPLREGISKYRSQSSNVAKKKTQVVVYSHVRITKASISSGKFGHVVQLDGKVRWEIITRFFIFGSLLLFTTDNFNTFFTGTVIDVDQKNGTIMVKLNGNYFKVCNDIYATEFVMAVSKVFFDPYNHVLSALQSMASEVFPMKRYIVEVNPDAQPPIYIQQLKHDKYTLFGQTQVDILNPIWPQFTEIKFNPSQQKAFQAALTNEFVAIQGPPGTGKTFLGSQIVSALLDNVSTNSPILIVCYKNHALDQFLERLLNKTKSLVRIGGRSQNENLKTFNLKDQRGKYGFKFYDGFLKELATRYFGKAYQLDGLRKHGILSIHNVLPYVVSPKLREELMWVSLEDWLMEGVYMDKEYEEENEEGLLNFSENMNVSSKVSKVSNDSSSCENSKGVNSKDIFEGENEEELFDVSENMVCSNVSQISNDSGSSENSKCVNSTDVFEELEEYDTEDALFELSKSGTFKNPSESTSVFCKDGLSEQRFAEMYIDDYSQIYDEVAEVVQEEMMNNTEGRQGLRGPCYYQEQEPYFTLTICSLKAQHRAYESMIQSLMNDENEDLVVASELYKMDVIDLMDYWQVVWETEMKDINKRISFLKRMLGKKIHLKPMKLEEIYSVCEEMGICSLSNSQRWSLYHSWVDSFAQDIKKELIKLEESIRYGEQQLDEARSRADLKILQKSKVVGVTTSGAAMNRALLNKLGANIVVIEEAAEVLESHIVTSLSSNCQHLILIGDHKQLRPNPAVYELCKKYNFDISLFERMVRNGLSCYTLDVQHRMRPEFASLITPSIYPHLVSHSSTENRPDIAGVHSNLYFITHDNPEEMLLETDSHVNKFEAKFVLQLANYLLLQGYLPEEITILATYKGQLRKIIKMKEQILPIRSDVRISTVDDFQGEENKIIILSLVRSNEEGKIGFLKTENRVCVALSRARDGLYIIGNMECLTLKANRIWPLVKEKLLEHNALGQTLSVYCQNHKETITEVKDGEMFAEMPEGGCNRKCEANLSCGHVCKYSCHPRDPQHRGHYMCLMPCERKCKLEHPCKKVCGEECGPCKWLVEFDLPCGHKMKAACSSDPATLLCLERLPCVLACGHESTRQCYEDEATVVVKKKCKSVCGRVRKCGHPCSWPCHDKDYCDLRNCEVNVEMTCESGHKFAIVKCWEKDYRAKILECNEKVEKTLACGHTCLAPCFHFKKPIICPIEVKKMLKCTHTQEVACGESVENIFCTKLVIKEMKSCRHKVFVECGLKDGLVCKEPCARLLNCGHECKKTCYERCICSTVVEKELPCSHKVKAVCGSNSVVCNQPCERDLDCGHKCEGKCGVKCDPLKCQKLTVSKIKPDCGHNALEVPCSFNLLNPERLSSRLKGLCTANCGTILQCGHPCEGECRSCRTSRTHAPCSQPCKLTLPCGHRCPKTCNQKCGGCNEKCLNKCSHRKCDRICGEPCRVCQELCNRGCAHQRCRRPCFAVCDRRPCPLPCPNPLRCGHPCLGFCGEPCPPLCLLCQPQHPLAAGSKVDDRLLILEDCGHIVNASHMDAFIVRNKGRIVKCPVVSCQTPIITTNRYHKEIKFAFSNIMKLNRELGSNNSNDARLFMKLNEKRSQENLFDHSSKMGAFLRNEHSDSNASSGRPYQRSENGFTSNNTNNNSLVNLREDPYHSNQQAPYSRHHLFNPNVSGFFWPIASMAGPFQTSQNRATTRNQSRNTSQALRERPIQMELYTTYLLTCQGEEITCLIVRVGLPKERTNPLFHVILLNLKRT